jgi:hypothetical protein
LSDIAVRINAFVSSHREFICDRCVKESLGLSHLTQVQQITGALGTTSDFQRVRGACSTCGKGKLVTRAVSPAPASPPHRQDAVPEEIVCEAHHGVHVPPDQLSRRGVLNPLRGQRNVTGRGAN